MIFVSGTKRSGTSMWMQIFAAGGFSVLGKAFPRGWDKTIKDANPDGFYESLLRQGIYYRTNPHPTTGQYFLPEHVKGYVVKVFVPGVVRSERAYIDLLVANVRQWREYEASIQRLYAMEDEHRKTNPDAPEPFHFPPVLEWWMENFALVRDISLRKYPVALQTYDQVLENPLQAIERVFGRTQAQHTPDLEAAVAAIKPEHRTQDRRRERMETDAVDAALTRVFDDLYEAIAEGKPLTGGLLKTLNETNRALLPKLTELQTKVAQSMSRMRLGPPPPIEGLPPS